MVTRRKNFSRKNNKFLKLILSGKAGVCRPGTDTIGLRKVRTISGDLWSTRDSDYPAAIGPLTWVRIVIWSEKQLVSEHYTKVNKSKCRSVARKKTWYF